jgi:hypothetical protein
MKNQANGNSGTGDSHEADIDAGFDNAEETTAPAGIAETSPPEETDDTSRDANIAPGNDHASDASDDDRRLGLR